jgi:hypothetical protein
MIIGKLKITGQSILLQDEERIVVHLQLMDDSQEEYETGVIINKNMIYPRTGGEDVEGIQESVQGLLFE